MAKKKSRSKGEETIVNYLKQLLPFFTVHTEYSLSNFENCPKNCRRLRIDIYIPDFKLAIEIDGEHHHEIVVYNNPDKAVVAFEKRKVLDMRKDDFLKSIGVKVWRLKTSDIEDINAFENKLKEMIR